MKVVMKVVGNAHKEKKTGVRRLGQMKELNKVGMNNVDKYAWDRAVGVVWRFRLVVTTSGEKEDILA